MQNCHIFKKPCKTLMKYQTFLSAPWIIQPTCSDLYQRKNPLKSQAKPRYSNIRTSVVQY